SSSSMRRCRTIPARLRLMNIGRISLHFLPRRTCSARMTLLPSKQNQHSKSFAQRIACLQDGIKARQRCKGVSIGDCKSVVTMADVFGMAIEKQKIHRSVVVVHAIRFGKRVDGGLSVKSKDHGFVAC